MESHEFIEKLKLSTSSVFTLSDLAKILDKNENYVKVFVNRLTKKELVRLEKNKYTLKETNPFLIASNIIFPSYISFLSAYSYYNLTNQLPRTFYVVTLKQKKPLYYENTVIQFIKFEKSRFFGFKKEMLESKFLFVAEPEKAIVDSLYLPKYCPISETFFAITNGKLDLEKLISFARRMNSSALSARLGYLLELAGIDIFGKLELPKNYVLLNPYMPKEGKKNKKWKVIVNEVLEC